jgi:hypothetical protein
MAEGGKQTEFVEPNEGVTGAGLPTTNSHGSPHAGSGSWSNIVQVVGQIADMFQFKDKKAIYVKRRALRDFFEVILKNAYFKDNEKFLVQYALIGAAEKGKAPDHVVREIMHLHDQGTCGMALLETLIERWGLDCSDRIAELQAEFQQLERRPGMHLREVLYSYVDIERRMKEKEFNCLPCKDVRGKKLISFLKTPLEKQMLIMLDKNVDIGSNPADYAENITRNPDNLLELLQQIALKAEYLKGLNAETSSNPLAHGAFEGRQEGGQACAF